MASLPTILLILAALSAGATVIAAIIAFRSQREASSAIFPIVREEERTRAQRARISIFVWIAVTALFLGGWLATLRLSASTETVAATPPLPPETEVAQAVPPTDTPPPPVEPSPTVAPIENDAPTLTPSPTDTPVPASTATPVPPSPTLTNTPLPEPSATFTQTPVPPTNTPEPTLTPTSTPPPTATPTPVLIVPPSDRTPAPPGVRAGPITFAAELDDDMNPVEPTTTFTDGVPKIFAVFPFKGMSPGLAFKAIWYKNGVEVAREEGEWEWGQQGHSFAFLTPQGPGLYKLDLLVNDTVVATKLFEVNPRPN